MSAFVPSFGRVRDALRRFAIRMGWKRCDCRNAVSQKWRSSDGTLYVQAHCPDCDWSDFGHVHE